MEKKRIEQKIVRVPEMVRPDYDYGFKDRPLNTKRSNYNTYLESITVYGTDDVVGTAVGATTYTPSTTQIIPLSLVDNQTGKLTRKFTSNGGLLIPVSGNYIISVNIIFNIASSGESEGDMIAAFGEKALLTFLAQAPTDGGTMNWAHLTSKRFDMTVDAINFGFSGVLEKGSVLYCQAAHKRDGVTIPTIAALYMTKIS